MQTVSYFAKREEVNCFITIWNFVGECSLQTRIPSRSIQYCSNCRIITTYISQTVEGNSESYMILHEIYQRICANHNNDGKVTEKGRKVSMDLGLPEGVGDAGES
jgi:hypothetical protein